MTKMTDPGRVLVAGDWHSNTRHAVHVIHEAPRLLAGEPLKVVMQLGDAGFGDWGERGSGDAWLYALAGALELAGAWLLVVPGNHEDYDAIESWREPGCPPMAAFSPLAGGERLRRISILPRGHRWQWHGRTWLACGGAASPDRDWRLRSQDAGAGKSWWVQERITGDDIQRCAGCGHADVLVSHDRPERARISLPPWPRMWTDHDLALCHASRHQLQRVCDAATPAHVIHGHYHQPFQTGQFDLGYGLVTVTQLDRDGEDGSFAVLDVRTMEWV